MDINNNQNNLIKFSVDRFENEVAVCENKETGEILNIPISALPRNVQKGSIIIFHNGKYVLDIESTKNEHNEIKTLVNDLFKRK